jgi:hypothetical protein
LALPGIYDDAVYLTAGLTYAKAWDNGGLFGTLASIAQNPPHGPFTTFLAMVAYLLLNYAIWAPYAFSALSFIGLWYLLADRWPVAVQIALSAAVGATYWFELTVAAYHPDLLMGMALAGAAYLICTSQIERWTWRDITLIVALVCLAMFTKPVGFAMIVVLTGTSVLAASALALRRRAAPTAIAWQWARLGSLTLIVLLPFLIWRGQALFDYFMMAVINHEHPVGYSPGFQPLAFAELTSTALGLTAALCLGLLLLSALAVVIQRRFNELGVLAALTVTLIIAYVVPTASPVKQFYFGGVIYALIVLIGGYSGSILYRSAAHRSWIFAALPAAVIAVLGIYSSKINVVRYPEEEILRARSWLEAGIAAIEARAPLSTIYMSEVTPVPSEAIMFELIRRDIPVPQILVGVWETSVDGHLQKIEQAQLAFMQDNASRAAHDTEFPGDQFLDQVIERLRNSADASLLSATPSYRGTYSIFELHGASQNTETGATQ